MNMHLLHVLCLIVYFIVKIRGECDFRLVSTVDPTRWTATQKQSSLCFWPLSLSVVRIVVVRDRICLHSRRHWKPLQFVIHAILLILGDIIDRSLDLALLVASYFSS